MNSPKPTAAGNGPRVPLVDQPSDAAGAALLDAIRTRRGGLLNLHRVMVHAPALMQASFEAAMAIRQGLHIPRSLAELVILRTAQLCGSHYEWQQHVPMALANGCDQAKIDALADHRASTRFTAAERAALDFCDAVVLGEEVPDAAFDALGGHFSPREIVELAFTATNYLGMARFIQAVRVPLEATPTR